MTTRPGALKEAGQQNQASQIAPRRPLPCPTQSPRRPCSPQPMWIPPWQPCG